MVALIMLCTLTGAYLLAYLTEILYGWELIFAFITAVPIYAYTRRNANIWSAYFLLNTLGIGARFLIAANANKLFGVSVTKGLLLQFFGVINIVVWLLWYSVIAYTMINTTRYQLKKETDIDTINTNHTIIRTTNLFSTTIVMILIDMTVSTQAYLLNEQHIHILVFIGIIVITAIACYILQVNMIRSRKEEIIENDLKNGKNILKEDEEESTDSEESEDDKSLIHEEDV